MIASYTILATASNYPYFLGCNCLGICGLAHPENLEYDERETAISILKTIVTASISNKKTTLIAQYGATFETGSITNTVSKNLLEKLFPILGFISIPGAHGSYWNDLIVYDTRDAKCLLSDLRKIKDSTLEYMAGKPTPKQSEKPSVNTLDSKSVSP